MFTACRVIPRLVLCFMDTFVLIALVDCPPAFPDTSVGANTAINTALSKVSVFAKLVPGTTQDRSLKKTAANRIRGSMEPSARPPSSPRMQHLCRDPRGVDLN